MIMWHEKDILSIYLTLELTAKLNGCGSSVVKVTGPWLACHEFKSSTSEDLPCSGAIHVKFVESSNVLPLMLRGRRGVVIYDMVSLSIPYPACESPLQFRMHEHDLNLAYAMAYYCSYEEM
ncbi:hypothetical protein TNCV_609791 [Trichonephila clavipes]|nr:hypothetical protein TNCV_609791 [Trichonephila clavipes]